jgi:division protein CdvB (Snf7/Vps24/ESCRT-III family)
MEVVAVVDDVVVDELEVEEVDETVVEVVDEIVVEVVDETVDEVMPRFDAVAVTVPTCASRPYLHPDCGV